MLRKSPALLQAERYVSARELHAEVSRYLDGERDLSLRKRLCREHLETAQSLVGGWGDVAMLDNARRARVLGELGHALALEPGNREVRALLGRILSTPPPQMPTDSQLEQRRQRVANSRNRVGYRGLFALAALGLLPVVVGVKSWAWMIAIVVPAVVAGLVVARFPRDRDVDERRSLIVLGLLAISVFGTTSLAGPQILAPGFAIVLAVIAMHMSSRRAHWLGVGLAAAAIVVPTVLEWAGLFPAMYQYGDGALTVMSPVIVMNETTSRIGVLLATLLTLGIAARFTGQHLAGTQDLQQRLFLANWHLQQLVPSFEADPPEP